MKKKSMQMVVATFIGVSLLVFEGFLWQAQAAMPQLELTGTVEKKERSPELVQVRYAEPGSPAARADRATAVIVDGNRMFILRETVIKKMGAVANKNEWFIIDFDEVAVPCQAKIVYQQLPNGNRNVLEVHILSELSGASKKWATPEPQ